MSKKNTFGIDAEPETFDINEWLNGSSLPARTIKIYRDGALRAKYDELEQRFLFAQSQLDIAAEKPGDESLAARTPVSEVYDLAKEMQKVIAELEKSALLVKVRALTGDEDAEIIAQTDKEKLSDDDAGYRRMATAVIFPKLTPDEWHRMREAIGEVQYRQIAVALVELAGFADGGQVVPDFSPAASALLSTKDS